MSGSSNPDRATEDPSVGGSTVSTGVNGVDIISTLIAVLSGQSENIAPRPGKGESVYDSYYHRMRTQQQMSMILDQFSNNMLTQKLHAQASQMGGLADMLSGGMISRAISPILGGNPVQAAMGMFQRMTGMSTAFTGQMGSASTDQVIEAMKQFNYSGNFYKMGAGRPEGIDYNKTRGFEVQDLMSSYLRANELGLFNGRKVGMTGGFTQFTGSSQMGALDAARSMGMNMDELSGMFGKSGDAFSEGNAGKTEDLLRKVKAAAHVAGISIKAMKDIIAEGQNLMAMFPELSYVGGDAMMSMSASAVGQARAMAQNMSPLEFRRAGGHSGLIRSIQQEQAQTLSEPGVQQMMALYERVAGSGGDVSSIVNYMKTGDRTPAGQSRFLTSYAQSSGLGAGISTLVNNAEMGRLGAARNPELASMAGFGMQEERFNSWFDQANRNLSGPQLESARQQMYKLWGANGGGMGGFAAATSTMGMDPFIQERMMSHLSYMGAGGESYLRSKNDPAFAAIQKAQDEAEQRYAVRDKAYADQFGHLNASPIHQAIGALISGEWSTEGGLTKSLTDIYTSNGPANESSDARDARLLAGKVAKSLDIGSRLLRGGEAATGFTQIEEAYTEVNESLGKDSPYAGLGADWHSFLQNQIQAVGSPEVLGMNSSQLSEHIASLERGGEKAQAAALETWRSSPDSSGATRARSIVDTISGHDRGAYMSGMHGLGSNPSDYENALRRVAAGGMGRNGAAMIENQMSTNLNATMNDRITEVIRQGQYGNMDAYKVDGKVNYSKLSEDLARKKGVFGEGSALTPEQQKTLGEHVTAADEQYKQGKEEISRVAGGAAGTASNASAMQELARALADLKPLATGIEEVKKAIFAVSSALGGAGAGGAAAGKAGN